jgi:type VI secretion system secreted protein VgrG
MLAHAGEPPNRASFFEYNYPGGYPDEAAQGDPLARAILQRYGVEARYATGESRCRALAAGSIVRLTHPKPSHEGEYLVTAIELAGDQGEYSKATGDSGFVPFRSSIECARRVGGASHFRPARRTPKPRVQGSQTAFVTAEPSTPQSVINVGDGVGCVRLLFHWDRDQERLKREPSSCWVRVSQIFAGGGEGGVCHPRVGVEVIVEFLEGDPDRPIVTGRVYNGARIPPAPSVGSPTISTWKSFSVPGGEQYNEILFDDAAGAEEIKVHAGRDWNTVVERNRTELVKSTSASTVGVDRTEATGALRVTTVGVNNTEEVGENEAITIGANQSLSVGVNQTVSIGMNQTTDIGGWQKIGITGDQTLQIHEGDQSVSVMNGNMRHSIKKDVSIESVDGTVTVRGELIKLNC